MPHRLSPLPYAETALAPQMSAEQLSLHHDRHHAAYLQKLNRLIEGTPWAEMKLKDLVRVAHGRSERRAIYQNASQAWNHDFFWKAMTPGDGGKAIGETRRLIERDFGSFDKFASEFVKAGAEHFGSGWAWLSYRAGKLSIAAMHDADSPLIKEAQPLLACDLWEHAYYVDYRNERKKFLETFLDKLANWEWAEKCLSAAQQSEDDEEARDKRKAKSPHGNVHRGH